MSGEQQVERVRRISQPEFERSYVRVGRPVLIEGAVDDWPALRRWGVEDLRARFGEVRVPCLSLAPGQAPTLDEAPQPVGARPRPTMAEYLDHLATRPDIHDTSIRRWYLNNVPIGNPSSPLAGLFRDVSLPPLFDHGRLENVGLFVGYETFSVLHYHARKQALAAAIVGKKKVTLWSPDDFHACDPLPSYHEHAWASAIADPIHPDGERHPRFLATRPLEVVIEPGALLVIPVHWFHLVRGFGLTINLTMFWKARREECRPDLWRRDRVVAATQAARERLRQVRRRLVRR